MSTAIVPISRLVTTLEESAEQQQKIMLRDPEKVKVARYRLQLVMVSLGVMENLKWSLNRAATHVYNLAGSPENQLNKVSTKLGKKGKPVGKAQISRWIKAYQKDGFDGLIDQRQGRQRIAYGWESRAMHLYARPQQPSFQLVQEQLVREGHDSATYSRVMTYLKSLPKTLTENSAGRLGAQYVRANARTYVSRDTSVIPSGHIYQGDGHTIDVWLAHPETGDTWRPELTVWIDIGSRYITGWYMSNAESANSTMIALARAMELHDHVPPALHIDNGSGFKAKMMSDDSTGFYARYGISTMFALPYNSKGKGQVERFFNTMENNFGKQFDSYCGADMSQEALNKIHKGVKNGTYQLPRLEEWTQRFEGWLEEYHNKPHRGLDGQTPAQKWAELERNALVTPVDMAIMPVQERTISKRATINLDNRVYSNPELLHYAGDKLLVQYALMDDSTVRVLDSKHRWICDAQLVERVAYLSKSRIEDQKQKAKQAAIGRLQVKIEETERRAGMTIGHEKTLDDLSRLDVVSEQVDSSAPPELSEHEPNATEITIDLTDLSYLNSDD